MTRTSIGRVAATAAVATASLAATGIAQGQEPVRGPSTGGEEPAFVPGEVVVRYEPGVSAGERAAIRRTEDLELEDKLSIPRVEQLETARGTTVSEAVASLEVRPEVAYAEPNFIVRAVDHVSSSDVRFGELWGLQNGTDTDIDAPEAWHLTTGSRDVVVAVVDGGVKYDHPDLAPNMWTNPGEAGDLANNGQDDDKNGFPDDHRGWDFVSAGDPLDPDGADNDPRDLDGHGTHVAGTIGAAEGGGDVVGVNHNVSIMPLRVLGSHGSGRATEVAEAFVYAGQNGADVVNASLASSGRSQAVEDAINGVPGTLFVAAAGNEGTDNDVTPAYPCASPAPNVVCVAATNKSDNLAGFSNFGATSVDLAAPGVGILSDWSRSTRFFDDFSSGTLGGWTTGGSGIQWGIENPESFGFTLSDSPGENYRNNSDSSVESPVVDLSGQSGCSLGYYLDLFTEPDADHLLVEASADGSTWTEVNRHSGDPFGTQLADLSAIGQPSTAQVRYRLVSNGSVTDRGALVDDVEVTCSGDSYRSISGTSMAAPHVSGVAALALAYKPGTTVADLKYAILAGAERKASLAGTSVTEGRLNANRTLRVVGPPTARVAGGPGPRTADPLPTFRFDSDQTGVEFQCRIGHNVFGCASGREIGPLKDSQYALYVRARQPGGELGPWSTDPYDFLVDTTGPRLGISDQTVEVEDDHIPKLVSCPAVEASGPCASRLVMRTAKRVKLGGRKRKVKLGVATFEVSPGERRVVSVKLQRAGRRLMAQRQSVKVRARANTSDSLGNTAVSSRRFLLLAD